MDLVGDESPELIFAVGGALGWAEPDPADPFAPWVFHAATMVRGYQAFTHGLGYGDVDRDGRMDLIEATGWFQQPASLSGDPVWPRHDPAFGRGGAQMRVIDADDDGDSDVVSTIEAHGYGLAWYEQASPGSFVERVIVPSSAPPPGADAILHEPHALTTADINGDGREDIVTGERFWGHVPGGDPDFAAPAHLYWFELLTNDQGRVQWIPHLVDDDSGVGTQVEARDVTSDGLVDIVVSNKKGAFVFVNLGP